ncbi:HAD hydrolase family protein [Photobacterium ganghwense]|uniref:HAD hydrolase family protein n=1 Tax=Photobacterium ganghwense TaxID=320778 RepID=UPI0039EF858E
MPEPLTALPADTARQIKWVFTDVDDTLTWEGRLPSQTLIALEQLQQAGIHVVAVTGACAGWCDHIAKLWPVHTVIGENGAFWMSKRDGQFITRFASSQAIMQANQNALKSQIQELLNQYPDIGLAADQPLRFCDVAVNIGQDRPAVDPAICADILKNIHAMRVNGQTVHATQSSIHINAWVGEHSKRVSSEALLGTLSVALPSTVSARLSADLSAAQPPLKANSTPLVYLGDSLNDEAMFEWLPLTIGVANIRQSLPNLTHKPTYITRQPGGLGFAEFADYLLQARQNSDK